MTKMCLEERVTKIDYIYPKVIPERKSIVPNKFGTSLMDFAAETLQKWKIGRRKLTLNF